MGAEIGFSSVPDEALQTISGLLGIPLRVSQKIKVSGRDIPCKEIFENFREVMGADKCDALVNDLTTTRMLPFSATRNLTDGQKLRSICRDIIQQCKQLRAGAAYLASEKFAPIFSPTIYAQIQKWITDENILLVGSRLLGEAFGNIAGTHEQRAEAVRKRLDERKNNFIEINLSNLGLTEVPPEIFTFQNLIELDLTSNKIVHFNAREKTLHLLDELYLKDNPLKTFIYDVGSFPTLQELNLSGTQLISFTAHSGAFPMLQIFNISDAHIGSFTVEGNAFSMLSEIESCEHTEIGSFVIATNGFPSLRTLHFPHQKVKTLDISERAFPVLTNCVFPSQIGTINVASRAFPVLDSIRLNFIRIGNFNVRDHAFPALDFLVFETCIISEFNCAKDSFPLLRLFLIKKTRLGIFNTSLRSFQRLKALEIFDSIIGSFNAATESFSALNSLVIYRTTFESISAATEAFSSLEKLDAELQITTMNVAARAFPALVDLKLENTYKYEGINELHVLKSGKEYDDEVASLPKTEFNFEIGAFPELTSLNLEDFFQNRFNPPSSVFPILERMFISPGITTEFSPEGVFVKLRTLFLSQTGIAHFNARNATFPQLRDLDLKMNRLTSFNSDLQVYPNLVELFLSFNPLKSFKVKSGMYPRLQHLRLGHTDLRNINLYYFPDLKKIDFGAYKKGVNLQDRKIEMGLQDIAWCYIPKSDEIWTLNKRTVKVVAATALFGTCLAVNLLYRRYWAEA